MGRCRKTEPYRTSCSDDNRKQSSKKQPITAYRATRLWNQVVNGFKRFMPLKTHRVRMQVYTNSFKKEEGQAWLQDFINETKLMKPISLENAAILLEKFVKLNIIEQVCSVKNWLRTPTVLYKFTTTNENRVEKLRTLRYYSQTPKKGTSDSDVKQIESSAQSYPLSFTPLFLNQESVGKTAQSAVEGDNVQEKRASTPKILRDSVFTNRIGVKEQQESDTKSWEVKQIGDDPRLNTVIDNNSSQLCTPCKRRQSLKPNPVFSSTPKDNSPKDTSTDRPRKGTGVLNNRALNTIVKSKRQLSGTRPSKGVKRLGKKAPIAKGFYEARISNPVIKNILDEFDDLIDAIDKQNVKKLSS